MLHQLTNQITLEATSMKKILLTTAFAALIATSATTFAYDTTGATDSINNTATQMNDSATQMKGKVVGKAMKHQMEADAARLNLTPEQRTKIDGIVKESKKDLDEDIRDVLDDKQKVEFDKIQAEHKAAWGS